MVAWESKKLSEILHESKIPSEKPDPSKRISVRLHQKGVEKRDFVNDKKGATRYYIRKKNQFIYGKQNIQRGAFGIIPEELDNFESSSDLPSFDVSDICLPEWIMEWLNLGNRYQELGKIARGAGSQRVSPKEFLSLSLPVPSIETQRKIIGHICSVRALNNNLWCEIDHQHMLLKQLRQAVLQEAIEGKLTAEWRKENPKLISGENSGKKLLERIKTEKEKLTKEGKIKKQKPLPPITEEKKPFELPEGWCWCRLGNIIKNNPRNGYSPKAVNYKTKYKTIKLGATTWGKFNPDQYKYIDEAIPEGSVFWLKKGDILIQRSNSIDYVGVSAVYTGESNEFIYPDLIMKIQIIDPLSIHYVHLFLSSRFTRTYFREHAKGSQKSMPKINQRVVTNCMFALPPFAEQQAIVQRVEKIMAIIDDMEKQINERKDQAEHLMQSVLREAFEENA